MSILIENVQFNNKEIDIYIEGNLISEIGDVNVEAEHVIDGKSKAAIPGLVNTHTHAAMTLLRSYADDMALQEWLSTKIWPVEANITKDDIYWGTKLACLEMIKSGTIMFNDMYYHGEIAAKAVKEMGIRGVLSEVFFDMFDETKGEKGKKKVIKGIEELKQFKSERVIPALGPHTIYTVSGEGLQWMREFADKHDLLMHFHLAESKKENEDFVKKQGMRPVPYLEKIGFLCENLVATHCVWLDKKDMEILARHKVKISHNPVSNMKLAVGAMLPYNDLISAGCHVSLGTDGCASNNNLDIFESMKFAALGQKMFTSDPTTLSASEVLKMATKSGAEALRTNGGEIAEGMLADILLLNLKDPAFTPNHNLISNIVYSANSSCVDTTICDGKILMRGRKVEGEDTILSKANEIAADLVQRSLNK
ncbi:MAG: amidohydrolase [Thermoplasmata archaeon]|nr:MAG: amidohydrolase [Thermoplasmata archaeon]